MEMPQLPPLLLSSKRRGYRLAAGEDQPRVARLHQAFAHVEDGLQFLPRLFGKCSGRIAFKELRQQDALHVVHHQQGRLLAEDAFDFLLCLFKIALAIGLGREARLHELMSQIVED